MARNVISNNGVKKIFTLIKSKFDNQFSNNRLESHVIYYKGTNTMTNLFKNLSYPCICITTTENITDKPVNKYGTVLIFKISSTRVCGICITTDNLLYFNSLNPSTSNANGWKT